ncbi:MAG: UDP-N-acetylglucosamine 2-epimerase (non-hydrolyzing) [Clostridia bacterium]
MKKIIMVFGTRPEAIKMAPLVKEFQKHKDKIQTIVCVSGQHRQMLDQVLECFNIVPDYDLSIMKQGQTLADISTRLLGSFTEVLMKEKPDMVFVHGDTSTALVCALASYYLQIKVAHVEAGLRTYDIYSPFPEEFNRQAIDIITNLYFAPTNFAKQTLLNEHKDKNVFVTGNTVIDAINTTVNPNYKNEILDWAKDSRLVLLTAHRRENLGENLHNIFKAIRQVVDEHKDIKVVYPVHLNPIVQKAAQEELKNHERIRLIEPLDVIDFHNFMARAYLILTDSGGVQEEAPHLGKPVLVLRTTTERPEGVEAGTLKLVGVNKEDIYREFTLLVDNKKEYEKMSKAVNPYGDGKTSQKIYEITNKFFNGEQ